MQANLLISKIIGHRLSFILKKQKLIHYDGIIKNCVLRNSHVYL